MIKKLALMLALFMPGAVMAHSQVALDSDVFVEKLVKDPMGRTKLVLEQPKAVVPGDKLVIVLNYQNKSQGPATNFIVTNPMPAAVVFQGSADSAALVSVDGGRNWGPLATLKVRDRSGALRPANPTDVTHVRWTFAKPIPAGSAGKLMFRGIVR